MNIDSLSGSSANAVASLQRVASSTRTNAAAEAIAGESGDSSTVSGPAQMLSKLKSLQASDPEKFAKTMADISDKLSQAADAATDPGEKKALSDLAGKFETAGKTGDLSALEPPKGGGHGGPGGAHGAGKGPPPAGGGAASSASSSKSSDSTDPADANQDGTVTEAERQAYEASKGASAYRKMAEGHDASKMHAVMDQVSSIVDAALG